MFVNDLVLFAVDRDVPRAVSRLFIRGVMTWSIVLRERHLECVICPEVTM